MRLERWLTILIITEIVQKLLYGVTKAFILRILIELETEKFEFVKDAVGVVSIAITEQELAFLLELVEFFGGVVLQNVPLLLETLAYISVDLAEPAFELWVTIGISVDVIERLEEVVGRGVIREAFNQSLQLGQRIFELGSKT